MNTAIVEASSNGYDRVVKFLLEDVRVNPVDQGFLGLTQAIRLGRSAVVDLLLEDERVKQHLSEGVSDINRVLKIASKTGHEDFVKNLLDSGKIPKFFLELEEGKTQSKDIFTWDSVKLPTFESGLVDESSTNSDSDSDDLNLTIRVHFHHLCAESSGCILKWIQERGYLITSTNASEMDNYPELDTFDWLIISSGDTGSREENHPWLEEDKLFINKAINTEKVVFGIGLGSLLIANALGSSVYPDVDSKYGWWPIHLVQEGLDLFKKVAKEDHTIDVFLWQHHTFQLPVGATFFGHCQSGTNQFFRYKNSFVVPFDLDITFEKLSLQLDDHYHLPSDPRIQSSNVLLDSTRFTGQQNLLHLLLEKMENILIFDILEKTSKDAKQEDKIWT
eukprot:TRINITY_DN1354_c0_g2_i9.p1 TRINITY_DN1354_c0_g2~~TRINITY_DN1354_c0_g2_i9.p1  ORF type:complete len:391 (+),score=77.17 TRINITY_DN1354_c0_g2_i9:709-1881(+)